MAAKKRKRTARRATRPNAGAPPVLRIIGGKYRGRKLEYSGDRRTRPMKDRLREAIFNLLGPGVKGMHAIDLFAGTGALALEALSRGAARATLIEQHLPTARIVRANASTLGVESVVEIVTADVFVWLKRGPELGETPWLVFCSPPYDFYVERTDAMLELLTRLIEAAPNGSLFAVESDRRFDWDLLQGADLWDVRTYAPAVVGIYEKER